MLLHMNAKKLKTNFFTLNIIYHSLKDTILHSVGGYGGCGGLTCSKGTMSSSNTDWKSPPGALKKYRKVNGKKEKLRNFRQGH